MKSRSLTAIYCTVVALAFVLFLAFPSRYLQCVREGISLWAVSVLPTALPMLFLTKLLSQTPLYFRLTRRLCPLFRPFGVSYAGGGCAILSFLSGYPAGSRAIADAYEQGAIPKDELLRAAALSTTSGPAFLVGVAGVAMAGDATSGWIMYLSHLAGVLLPVWFLARFSSRKATSSAPPPIHTTDTQALQSSVFAVLTVGGAIALFYCFGCMLTDLLSFLPLPDTLCNVLTGLVEMTTGCAHLLTDKCASSISLCVFLVTFGGGCVLLQQWTFLCKTPIRLRQFLSIKLLQAIVAALIAYLLSLAFG